MKRRLVVVMDTEFNHEKNIVDEAFAGANLEQAKQLAVDTLKTVKNTAAIEYLLFENKANFQTKILAVFLAGMVRGNNGPPSISIEIKNVPIQPKGQG